MSKDELCMALKVHLEKCEKIKEQVNKISSAQVNGKELRADIETIGSQWFEFSKQLKQYYPDNSTLEPFDLAFKKLLSLSEKPNRKSSFEAPLGFICKNFRTSIIIYLQTEANDIDALSGEQPFEAEVKKLLDRVSDKDENAYLLEALGCWKHGYLKGATVLLWCAAIDRIHRVIATIGFDSFNRKSEEMKAQTTGRYKKFNKNQNVNSLSDLRNVPDGDLLWIIEGMELIDSNQKNRLSSCFEMRCHSGHPGAAPITKYNVISCLSDIVEIVLDNTAFKL